VPLRYSLNLKANLLRIEFTRVSTEYAFSFIFLKRIDSLECVSESILFLESEVKQPLLYFRPVDTQLESLVLDLTRDGLVDRQVPFGG
jgi:hypothetical protein